MVMAMTGIDGIVKAINGRNAGDFIISQRKS